MDNEKLLPALYALRQELGADFEKYVNLRAFAHSRDFMERYRIWAEDDIARQYLPGFRFDNLNHAAWHFRTRDFAPYWIFNAPIPPKHFADSWVRALLVPDRFHYLAEVAHALQNFDNHVARWIRDLKRLQAEGDAREVGRAVHMAKILKAMRGLPAGPLLGERDLMGMPSWPKRIRMLFDAEYMPKKDRALFRWPNRITEYRRQRRQGRPRSGWIIKSINFHGRLTENTTDKTPAVDQRLASGYLESWEWVPIGKQPTPKRTELSFWSPASPDLWIHAWKHRTYPLT